MPLQQIWIILNVKNKTKNQKKPKPHKHNYYEPSGVFSSSFEIK